MSVLYPLTLRRGCTHSKIKSATLKILLFLMVAIFSFQGSFAQDEKDVQNRKEAELKKQEADRLVEKLKANPKLLEKITVSPDTKQSIDQLKEEEQKKASAIQAANEAARYNAKMLEQQKAGLSLPGVEYKIITTGSQVEYVITNKGAEILRQQVNTSGSPYDKQVQAEKEAIYAANILRANNNYPIDALKNEIKSLASQSKRNVTAPVNNNNQRVNADYTFNGGGGAIPGTGTSGPASPYPATITVSGVPAGAIV